MNDKNTRHEHFTSILKGKFASDFPLKNLNWFKVGGKAQYFYSPYDSKELKGFLQNANNGLLKYLPIYIIGAGSNVLIRDKGIKGIVIKLNNFTGITLSKSFKATDTLEADAFYLEVEAGTLNISVANFAYNNSIGGLEFLSGIPGTIGGGIAMNAGAFGREYKDILVETKAIDYEGNHHTFKLRDLKLSYRDNGLLHEVNAEGPSTQVKKRNLIFTSALIKGYFKDSSLILQEMSYIKKTREINQPSKVRTGGSTFANPEKGNLNKEYYTLKAWQLIDKAGLRGYSVGGAKISDLHCNFIINYNNATASDIEKLINKVIKTVKDKFQIVLTTEIKILGELT
ncbi:UDP-N-acetylmuramate dehydrogenase [Candidatus Hepatincolaceae symbiont of Richtersius coronifer]